jgi:hypothetical protein
VFLTLTGHAAEEVPSGDGEAAEAAGRRSDRSGAA